MPKLTSLRLQLLWGVFVATIALASLLPFLGIDADFFNAYFSSHWVHFLAYAAVSFLPLLAWRRNTALALSMSMALLGAGLEIARATVGTGAPDVQYIVINALGVAAGILLGLNILTRRSRANRADI